ncbi:hypothetical protein QQG74_00340 [Micromonospora sp. FIMYZ51]|uniref:hypothetical protein n=1 Tax=Micromonospora sp. FIMYZ51 TaxID=3051832 RepID=UPI00311E4BB8
MAMVNLSARWPHRSRIVHSFGLLALLGATILVVLVRDPALSSTRLAEPVPAPEITVVESDPLEPDGRGGAWDDFAPAHQPGDGLPGDGLPGDGLPGDASGYGDAAPPGDEPTGRGHATGTHSADELSRSLFWSGLFGLTISLAGLGLVGTRRRMW